MPALEAGGGEPIKGTDTSHSEIGAKRSNQRYIRVSIEQIESDYRP